MKIFTLVWILIGIIGCSTTTVDLSRKQDKVEKYNTTIILGTYTWDAETDKLGGSTSLDDFWWQRVDDTHGNLMAKNGATVEVSTKSFDNIDKHYIKSFPILRDARISSSDIKVGTVAMFRTVEGRYGKLEIIGFKALHDFDFKEIKKHATDSWKKFVLAQKDTKEYHLMIKYHLYK